VGPELSARYERHEHALAAKEWLRDGHDRSEAIRLVQSFPVKRLFELLGRIGENAAKQVARQGASSERQQSLRSVWTDRAEDLSAMLEKLDSSLRAARGVPVAQTRKEWAQFEQQLVESLRRAGFSYGEITRLRRPGVRTTGADATRYRAERERVRGSARRARSRKP
jgi:hypothetical protein